MYTRELVFTYQIGWEALMIRKYLLFTALSAAGGLLLGGPSNKRKTNLLNLPSFRGVLEVKSSLPGRIRFFSPYLKCGHTLASQAEQQIRRLTPITHVSVNTTTGSLLVCYQADTIQPHLLQAALLKLLGLDESAEQMSHSVIGKQCRNIADSLSQAVAEKTGGLLDLDFLLAATLIGMGLYRVIKQPNVLPNGYTMLRWGTNQLFKGGRMTE